MLVCGWSQNRAIAYLAASIVLLNAGAYLDLFISCVRLPRRRLIGSFARTKLAHFGQSHVETLASIVFLPHQALVAADAIIRTLVRRFVTGRHLLEWASMAQADSTPRRGMSLVHWYLFLTPIASCALLVSLERAGHAARMVPIILSSAWLASPWFASWMDRRPARAEAWSPSDLEFLRGVALRTWRYFFDWSRAETHWFVPDNVDDTSEYVAYRTSPTNVGLQLGSTLAAHDFGYLTHRELARSLACVLDTLESLERYRGHFYNWYDIRTLQPLFPRYVSSVDSGNLCASLLTINQGCMDVLKQPIVSPALSAGLLDHCVRLREALPRTMAARSPLRTIEQILDDASRAGDLKSWLQALEEVRPLATELTGLLALTGEEPPSSRHESADAQYWAAALVDRIDAALAELRTFVPFIAHPLLRCDDEAITAWMRELEKAAVRPRALSHMSDHYDDLERSVRDCLTSSDTLSHETVGHLVRLLEQIASARDAVRELVADLQSVAARAATIALGTDFAFLLDGRRKLLRVGYSVDSGELDSSCYGLLASEARTAVFLAIAKHDIPRDAWFHLGRKLASYRDSRALLSWSGSMFEYAMPTIFMKSYDNTLLGVSLRRAVRIQQLYAAERRVPWGISEAAYSGFDGIQERRYQAFGVPGLAMKRMRSSDLVVAPYATLLGLMIDASGAINNLRAMALKRWIGRYGFFESIDYRGVGGTAEPRIVPLFMAHHQGMSIMALDNAVFDGAMQTRFHSERLVLAAELLLQERVPKLVPVAERELSAAPPSIHLQVAANLPDREIAPAPGGAVMPAA
jgi:cyclic beta-1,2-glucan synthetase